MSYISAFAKGLSISAGLIIPIGAQNAFVIKQGITRRHILLTALLCASIDAILINLGVKGLGSAISVGGSVFIGWIKWGSIIFLMLYGIISLHTALVSSSEIDCSKQEQSSVWMTICSILAISLLNPHVYLDTIVLIGSIGSQQLGTEKLLFTLGAMSASFIWFLILAFGAKRLAPILSKPKIWRTINILISVMMFSIAMSLVR